MDKMQNFFEHEKLDLIREISPDDSMYQAGNKEHYFNVGRSALKNIKLAVLAADKHFTDMRDILDMPSGYGRVLRYLRAFFQEAQITACDIERNAVDFCRRVFNARAVYSEKRPSDINITDRFDLIWCGSLLTHLNLDRWPEFLDFFRSVLNSHGILVFTVHGRYCVERIRSGDFTYGLGASELRMLLADFYRNGFGYVNYPNADEYGISLSSPSHVLKLIEKFPDFNLLLYNEKGWDNHHDVVACIKI